MHNIVYSGMYLIYWAMYHFEWEFFMRYKINDLPWPWEEDAAAYRTLAYKSCVVAFINSNILSPGGYYILDCLGLINEHAMDMESLPDTFTIILQVMFFIFCEDFSFYLTHRFLHWAPIYPYIHKMHH